MLDDFLHGYTLTHAPPAKGSSEYYTVFQQTYPNNAIGAAPNTIIDQNGGGPHTSVHQPMARFLADYQKVVYTWGPLLAVGLFISLLAVVGVGRARRATLRPECLFLTLGGVLIFLSAIATALFGFRYQLPALVLLPPATVLAVSMLKDRSLRERRPLDTPRAPLSESETEPAPESATARDGIPGSDLDLGVDLVPLPNVDLDSTRSR